MEPYPVYAVSSRESTSLRETYNFEVIFGIPPAHRLLLVRSRSQGCPAAAIAWEHDEYATDGRLVAHYQSFEQVNALGKRESGWRKFNCDGQLASEKDSLS
jgi:hypothetical protein